MTKSELIARLSAEAHNMGQSLGRTVVDAWIDADLMSIGARDRNDGIQPRYDFDEIHLERGNAILRLRAEGLTDYDAILLRLFLDGGSFSVPVLQEALRKEYDAFVRRVNAPVRSRYADNLARLTPKRRDAFERQLGEVDSRFRAAGLVFPIDDVIAVYRTARRRYNRSAGGHPPAVELAGLDMPSLVTAAPMLLAQYAGGFLRRVETKAHTGDRVGDAISIATADDWRKARELFNAIEVGIRSFGLIGPLVGADEALCAALNVAGRDAAIALRSAGWSASALGVCLVIAQAGVLPPIAKSQLERLVKLAEKRPKQIRLRINRALASNGGVIYFGQPPTD